MSFRILACIVVGLSAACGGATTKPPVANTPAGDAPTDHAPQPASMKILLADATWQERYPDAIVRGVDAHTFSIDTSTEQVTLTTGPDAATTFDAYHDEMIARGRHIEQSMGADDHWEIVASREGLSIGAAQVVGADGPVLCRFELAATTGWITPLGLCQYVLGIVAAH